MFAGNQYWFGLRKPPCQFLFGVCPCLQLFGNVSYSLYTTNNNNNNNNNNNSTMDQARADAEVDIYPEKKKKKKAEKVINFFSLHTMLDIRMSLSTTYLDFHYRAV